ncbi:MAG: DUF6494 family protein [Thalassovita sp.]|nr:DUF6494 family protein [Thalassovita sp.]
MNDELNMSVRKFLKQVGVTSQQAIEAAYRDAGAPAASGAHKVKMVLTIDDLGLEHVIEGEIKGGAE